MAVKKGLGRGIDLLIPSGNVELSQMNIAKKNKVENTEEVNKKSSNTKDILYVDINQIEPNRNQPRKKFDEDSIDELTDSIKQYGILQPLVVKKKDQYYEIVAGERRWRASKKAGLKEVPVIIKQYDESEALKISLIENLQREDLNPIEEAKAYQILQEEYNLKQEEIAISVSKSRAAITNTMRLLKLNEDVQKMIMEGIISSGHGRTLLALEDKNLQYEVAVRILDHNMSVRETEKYIKKIINIEKIEKKQEEPEDNEMIHFFETRMKDILGSKVQIKERKNNKGKIEIEYYSHDELERIIDLIQSIRV